MACLTAMVCSEGRNTLLFFFPVIYDTIILRYSSGKKKISKKLALGGVGYYNIQNVKKRVGFVKSGICNRNYWN
jgi:hypothetical protein